jgi:hypothetical protein
MAKNHSGQMALYEVVNKERFKAAQKKELSRLVPDKPEKVQPAAPAQPVTIAPQQPKNAETKQTVWTKKSRIFDFGKGRIEAFVPYPIAVTVVMGLALLLLVVFRVGQGFGKHQVSETPVSKTSEKSVEMATVAKEMARSVVAKRASSITPAQATTTTGGESAKGGDYVIVLAELKNAASARDMEPAKQYFDENGIATEIKSVRGSYFLVTKENYDGVGRGTPGAAIIEKIGQIGAKYKAPAGYGGFGSKPFSDAYGRKM